MTIRIASDLSLPLEAVTQTFGILAVRGAGKSNAAAVMAEGMANASLPFVVVDPTGSWWGLRSSGDGKGPGLGIPIFGGRHADVPLERTAGQMIADLIVEHRLSSVVDVSEFSEGDKIRFLTDFAERLYRKNEDPLHLFLEEADDYVPQRPFREQARCLRAWENIVRRGRARGLGITMISQRSAAINKNVLTQIETLIVLRTTSPQDRKAIEGWVTYHGQSRELLESLPGLGNGEAWVWSPHWLGKLVRVQIRRRETFDSAATPKNVRGKRPPATLADVDLVAVRKRMAETIEKAKAEDPRELRLRIAALEGELRKVKAAPTIVPPGPEEIAKIRRAAAEEVLLQLASNIKNAAGKIMTVLEHDICACVGYVALNPKGRTNQIPLGKHRAPKPPVDKGIRARGSPVHSTDRTDSLGNSGLRRMLIALAQRNGLTAKQLGVRAGMSSRSGTFSNYLGRGRSNGWVNGSRDRLGITEAGRAALGSYDPLPEGKDLLSYWLGELGNSGAMRMLSALAERYPNPMTAEELGEIAEISAGSGTFSNYLGKLRTLELVTGSRSHLLASEELF